MVVRKERAREKRDGGTERQWRGRGDGGRGEKPGREVDLAVNQDKTSLVLH